MTKTPEQKARRGVDGSEAAGWCAQGRGETDLTVARCIGVREFTIELGFGFADYLRYIDEQAAGAIEA